MTFLISHTPDKTSYLFPESPPLVREEGAEFSRVIVTPNKMTVVEKRFIRTTKSGVLFERVQRMTTYMVCENSSGVKYLKILTKERGASKVNDSSLATLKQARLAANNTLSGHNQPLVQLIDRTILNWFGYECRSGLIDMVKNGMLFPALEDGGAPLATKAASLANALVLLQKDMGTITKSLRENSKWSDFVKEISSSAVVTKEDVALVTDHPHFLKAATLDLGVTLSELWNNDRDALNSLHQAFTWLDMNLIRFMLENIPHDKRKRVVENVLYIARTYHSQNSWNGNYQYQHFGLQTTSDRVTLKRVPEASRNELATILAASLSDFVGMTALKDYASNSFTGLTTGLSHAFRYWFAENVVNKALKTERTREEVGELFAKLFGDLPASEIQSNGYFYRTSKGDDFLGAFEVGPIEYQTDLFSGLLGVLKRVPTSRGSASPELNGYVNEKGSFVPLTCHIYSLDDVVQIVEDGVAELDSRLAKLRRDITPENRVAYLTYGHKERKFANTWRYYDLGVTDPERVLALKMAKITRKDDIALYADLPDDMFYDFLETGSGKTLTVIS